MRLTVYTSTPALSVCCLAVGSCLCLWLLWIRPLSLLHGGALRYPRDQLVYTPIPAPVCVLFSCGKPSVSVVSQGQTIESFALTHPLGTQEQPQTLRASTHKQHTNKCCSRSVKNLLSQGQTSECVGLTARGPLGTQVINLCPRDQHVCPLTHVTTCIHKVMTGAIKRLQLQHCLAVIF